MLQESSTQKTGTNELVRNVSKSEPCRHCGKPDWCYRIGELEVCNRQATPATGWTQTSKTDKGGNFFYAQTVEQKPIRPQQTRYWEYLARDGSELVRVCRVDDGEGKKKIWQERWDGYGWVKGLGKIPRQEIPIYRYAEVREAIKQGKTIFLAEGEVCVDALWELGIAATCNIGGAGKWSESDSDDLEGAKKVVLSPDRDNPGVMHMVTAALTLPNWDEHWLLAFPDSPAWKNLPKSGGVDVADWIADYKLSADDIEKAVIQDAELFRAKIEKQFPGTAEGKQAKKTELPAADKTAATLAERYKNELAWESEYQLWRHYGAQHDGMWSVETPESVRRIVNSHLRCLEGQPDFGAGSVSSVVTILQSDLEVKELNEQKGLLPLRDGVLDLETMQLKPHSPNYRFTWQLPFNWKDRGVGCKPIEEFLLKITGNEQIAEVLLCYLAAIVTRRSDLQRYLELIGGGGTGKSTFMALAKALAGDENAVSSQLHLLEKNQFETSRFYRKLLVLFPDSERWQGGVSGLKQLTGQDPVRYERKNIQQSADYIYEGMVILSANEAPESNDRTSGQERRKLTIGLDNRIPEYEGRELAEEFKQYLPGLLKRVLEIPRERVTALIKHTEKNVPALAQKKWAQLIETNPIAAWVDECLIFDPAAKLYIGKDVPEGDARRKQWAYPNFLDYQKESGHRTSMPVKRFSSNLRDLLKNQRKAPITEHKDRNGAYIQGVGLRSFYDPNNIRYSQPLTGECDGLVTGCDGLVMAETIGSDGCDGCDGFLENSKISEKNQEIAASEKIINHGCVGESEKNPSHPSHPAPVSVPTVTNPSQEKANPSQTETKQGNLLYQRSDGQIEIDKSAIADAAPINEPKEDLSGWFAPENLQGMALSLCKCEDAEALALAREFWPPEPMNAACKLLPPEKHAQIKQWVIELNAKKKNG